MLAYRAQRMMSSFPQVHSDPPVGWTTEAPTPEGREWTDEEGRGFDVPSHLFRMKREGQHEAKRLRKEREEKRRLDVLKGERLRCGEETAEGPCARDEGHTGSHGSERDPHAELSWW